MFDDEPSASEGGPERGSEMTKPSVTSTGQSLRKESRMSTAFFSLLGSLAQANFVWNGDIVLNVTMSDGSVDWLGLCGLAAIACIAWVASRKR